MLGRSKAASESDMNLGGNSHRMTFLVDHLIDDFAVDFNSMRCYTSG